MAKKKIKNIEPTESSMLLGTDEEMAPARVEKATGLECGLDETLLRVLEALTYSCKGCLFLHNAHVSRNKSITDQCIGRTDRKSVILKYVKK